MNTFEDLIKEKEIIIDDIKKNIEIKNNNKLDKVFSKNELIYQKTNYFSFINNNYKNKYKNNILQIKEINKNKNYRRRKRN